jgi:hypothetical protein
MIRGIVALLLSKVRENNILRGKSTLESGLTTSYLIGD